jgi:threonine dehydrogenase-like Zn-dependent dehydrogenase
MKPLKAVRLVESNRLDVRPPVSRIFPLARAVEAFALAGRREGLIEI